MHTRRPSPLAAIERDLPFAADDFDAARDAYVRWDRRHDPKDRQRVMAWAYAYALDYFDRRFKNERTAQPSDLDRALSRAVRRVFTAIDADAVREPARFPQFVSVVCKRVLLSHRERRRDYDEYQEGPAATPTETGPDRYDRALARHLVGRAIDALVPSLQEVARLRLLGGLPYDEVARRTGHPTPTARAYASRALARLREDPDLRALYQDEIGGAGGDGWLRDGGPDERSPGVRSEGDASLGAPPPDP